MGPFDPRLTLVAAAARVKTCHAYHCFQAMRVQGKAFHAAAFAQFAGLEERHVMAIIAALTDADCLPQRRQPVERRATRLDDDWTPPEAYITYAIEKRQWMPSEAAQEAEQFHNYWSAQPDAKARKTDWLATWRNWVQRSNRPDGIYKIKPNAQPVDRAQSLRDRIALYERMGRDLETTAWREELARLESNVVPLRVGER